MSNEQWESEIIRETWRTQADGVFTADAGYIQREISSEEIDPSEYTGDCLGCAGAFCF